MRFAEIALFAAPFLVFAAWLVLAPAGGPPKLFAMSVALAVLAMAILLVTLWYRDAVPPDAAVIPARLENGRIVPPRVERAPPAGADRPVPSGEERARRPDTGTVPPSRDELGPPSNAGPR